ncbi:hypothetical protein BSM4216_2106 [Bacillus smithii]|jgi:hypothetical protein|nr:hypothetical protein BSM4216_2106 [Bacillus smithii]
MLYPFNGGNPGIPTKSSGRLSQGHSEQRIAPALTLPGSL